MNVVFTIMAVVAIVASVMAITRYHALHAILYLIVSFAAIAVIFYLLGAPFIAALEIITYAGAIMVLFLFAIMLLNLGRNAVEQEKRWQPVVLWIGPAFVALVLLAEFLFSAAGAKGAAGRLIIPSKETGLALLGPYAIGVELAALLLLTGLVGATHLGRRDFRSKRSGDQ